MKKKINIVPYDPKWPEIFKIYEKQLKVLLKENCTEIHHVGSTSVPGLCAKPQIDVLCVVKDLKKVTPILKDAGYTPKGEFNLPLRLFFSKREPYNLNLHVVNENSGEIGWQLTFRNYLRENEDARDRYANTKLNLLKKNPDGFSITHHSFTEYTIMKGETICEIAKQAGFNGYRFVIASNYNEIAAYKKMMNLKELDFNDENIFHLCLYKSTDIVAVACVEFARKNSSATIKSVKCLDKKYETILLDKINEWLDFHGLILT